MKVNELEKYIKHYLTYYNYGRKINIDIINNITNAIKNKQDASFVINRGFTIFVFGKKTSELLEKNSKVSFIFKIINIEGDEYCGFFFINNISDNIYSSFSSDMKYILKFIFDRKISNDSISVFKLFEYYNFDIGIMPNFLPCSYFTKENVEKIIGSNVYKEIFPFFLKQEKLVLVNGIIQLY